MSFREKMAGVRAGMFFLLGVLLCGFGDLAATASETGQTAPGSATIFIYHRFGEDDIPRTNTTIKQFEAHLAEIRAGDYTPMALPDIVAALEKGMPLPDRAVAITIDDGYLSVYREAWPRLRDAAIPFTLFLSTDSIDAEYKSFMRWEHVREMVAAGNVTIGHHGAAHQHMPHYSDARNLADIRRASLRFKEELGFVPDLFAYPYGEYSMANRKQIAELGFRAAFGQHSGAVYPGMPLFELPRFPMNQRFGDIDRFQLAADALPFPVTDVTPSDTYIVTDPNPPRFGFTVAGELRGLDRLNCFASGHEGPVKVEFLGDKRVEVRMRSPFAPGRGRINCTLLDRSGRWHWLGRQFVIAPPRG